MHNIKGSGTVGADMVTAWELPEMLRNYWQKACIYPEARTILKEDARPKFHQ